MGSIAIDGGTHKARLNRLASAMRRYAEECARFPSLKEHDLEEAVDNVDRAIDEKLEAFHALIDSLDETAKSYLKKFSDVFLILEWRNRRHHEPCPPGLMGWNYEVHHECLFQKKVGATFLFANFGECHVGRYFVSLRDILDIPDSMKSKPSETKWGSVKRDLKLDCVQSFAEKERYPLDQVYLNVIPVFCLALSRIFCSIQNAVSNDCAVYVDHFTKIKNDSFLDAIKFDVVKPPIWLS